MLVVLDILLETRKPHFVDWFSIHWFADFCVAYHYTLLFQVVHFPEMAAFFVSLGFYFHHLDFSLASAVPLLPSASLSSNVRRKMMDSCRATMRASGNLWKENIERAGFSANFSHFMHNYRFFRSSQVNQYQYFTKASMSYLNWFNAFKSGGVSQIAYCSANAVGRVLLSKICWSTSIELLNAFRMFASFSEAVIMLIYRILSIGSILIRSRYT